MVDVVRTRRGPAAVPSLPRGGGWLFAETAGDTLDEARAAAGKLVADGGCLDSAVITGPAAAALWRIREDGAGLGGRTPAGAPAWPGWEDSAVPPASLPAYLRELEALMAAHGLDGLLYGHFGDGCIHARIDFPLRDRPSVLRSFTQDAARLAASYGGSASGEHGDGRARGELLPAMYSATAIGLFGAVKQLFDPSNLLNPGVIVDPAPLDADLRVPLAAPLRRNLGFAYAADGGDFTSAVHRCTGVGKCRADNTASGGVMCPSYLATRDEKDSTRGRARVLQELANGSLVSSGWQSPEVAEALDLCLSCKGLLDRLPGRGGHGHLQGGGAVPALPGQAPARVALHARLAAPLGGADGAGTVDGAGWPTPPCGSGPPPPRPSASAASTSAGTCPYSPTQSFRRWFAERAGPPGRHRTARRTTARTAASPPPAHARAAVGGHVHQRVRAAGRPGRGRGPRGGRIRGADHRGQRLLRPHLDLNRPARRGQAAAEADARRTRPGPRRRHPGRRARAVVHGRAPRRRGRTAAERPPRGGARRSREDPGRAAHQHRRLDSARPVRRHRGGPAALPSACGARLGRRQGAAGQRGRDDQGGRRLLRTGRELRRRARPLRRVRRRRRDRPAPGRPRGRRRSAAAPRRSWPTGSPAAPSSTSWPTSTAPTWPSCWPSASARAGRSRCN